MPLLKTLANLVYPPVCLLCRTGLPAATSPAQAGWPSFEAVFCCDCAAELPRLTPPLCTRCGLGLSGAFDASLACASCRKTPLAFDAARAPWWYAGRMQEAVRQFKYHRRWRIGRQLADDMAALARSSPPLDAVDAVVPVPSHWLRRRLRGFHPAAYLAQAIARALRTRYLPSALSRRRWTATQTDRRWPERFRNVRGAFCAHQASVNRRSLLLVDDVLTSGATAHACALALKEAGAQAVFVLTAARTPLK